MEMMAPLGEVLVTGKLRLQEFACGLISNTIFLVPKDFFS
jgi:hypothetical protein